MYTRNDIMLLVERSRMNPRILEEVARGLYSKDDELAGDCAELMHSVAEQASDVVRPYADCLVDAAEHPDGRVHDEARKAMHVLGLRRKDRAPHDQTAPA